MLAECLQYGITYGIFYFTYFYVVIFHVKQVGSRTILGPQSPKSVIKTLVCSLFGSFCALMLLAGQKEFHSVCKNCSVPQRFYFLGMCLNLE